jgi:hypothetical protein
LFLNKRWSCCRVGQPQGIYAGNPEPSLHSRATCRSPQSTIKPCSDSPWAYDPIGSTFQTSTADERPNRTFYSISSHEPIEAAFVLWRDVLKETQMWAQKILKKYHKLAKVQVYMQGSLRSKQILQSCTLMPIGSFTRWPP